MKARLVFNKIIPFKGFKAITIWPLVFVRSDASKFTDKDKRHETTHLEQQLEVMVVAAIIAVSLSLADVISWWWCFVIPVSFYLIYVLEWIIRIPFCGFDSRLAYYNISTEQEAYLHEDDLSYNYERKRFAWVRYLFKKSFIRNEYSHKIVKRQ